MAECESCKEKDEEIAALQRVATGLTERASGAKRGGKDASLGFQLGARHIVVRGTPEDCAHARDAMLLMLRDMDISRNNVTGLADIVGRIVKGDPTAMADAKRVVEKIEANGGIFSDALLSGVLSSPTPEREGKT